MKAKKWLKDQKKHYVLYLLALPGILYYLIFHYVPMYGVVIAFKDFNPSLGILGSSWVGLKWFNAFFKSYFFWRIIKNTLVLSAYSVLWGFPLPIIFALMLNELKNGKFKKSVQTISYLPHFLSTVVIVGMMYNFLSPSYGIVNNIIKSLGFKEINFMSSSEWFRTLFVGSNVWQHFGWGAIIYLAALSGIDPQLYEASEIDGAGRFKQMLYITLPSIMPTIAILLILRLGRIMSVGFEKVILMYSPATYEVSDIISTFVYRRGILGAEFSFGAAVGLFNAVINLALIYISNIVVKKMSGSGIW